jgi:hypothetical protein
VVQVDPAYLLNSVTYSLNPTRSAELQSVDDNGNIDGALIVRINPGAVRREASMTIARIAAEHRPKGVLGDAFLLSPEITTLDHTIRLRIMLNAGDVDDASALRLARLDTGDRFYLPISGQAVVHDGTVAFAGGETMTFGVFAVVDTRQIEVREDHPPTHFWAGMHYLDMGAVRAANQRFAKAVLDDPQSPPIAFAAGLTRLLLVPELPELAAFFAACDQPVWNVDQIFGASGTIDRELAQEAGPSEVSVAIGFDEQNAVLRKLAPTKVSVRVENDGLCLDGRDMTYVPDGHWLLEIADPDLGGIGASLEVEIRIDPAKPLLSSDLSLAELIDASGVGHVDIALSDLNGDIRAYRGDKSKDEGPNGNETLRLDPQAPGQLRFFNAPSTPGEAVLVGLEQVTLLPPLSSTVPEVVVLSGIVEPVLAVDIASRELPLLNEDGVQELLRRCDVTKLPVLDQAFLRTVISAVGAEADSIADLWLLASADPSFRFDISMGLVASPGQLPIGAAEAGLLAAALKLVAFATALFNEYDFIDGDLRGLLVDVGVDEQHYCDPCSQDICATTTTIEPMFAAQLTVDALEGTFLSRSATTPLSGAKLAIADALRGVRQAVASTSVDTIIVVQKDGASAAGAAIAELVDVIELGLDATSHLDGARVFFDSDDGALNLFLTLANIFDTPPTDASLRSEYDIDPSEPTWTVGVDSGRNCPEPCTDEAALVPESAEWLLGGLMLEAMVFADEVECTVSADCGSGEDFSCSDDICSFPTITDHVNVVLDAFQTDDAPAFFNQKALTEIEAPF